MSETNRLRVLRDEFAPFPQLAATVRYARVNDYHLKQAMAKVEDERFDRAVAALDAVVAQAVSISPSYEDGLVAGMMDFLNDWFSDEAHRATGEFGLGYRVFVPSPIIILAGKRPATTFGFHALSNQFATRNNKSRLWAGPVGTLANASDWQS